MTIAQANELLFANFKPKNSEILPVLDALGRVLAQDVIAVKNLPCFDNSALDGYAVKFDEKEHGYVQIASVFAGEKKILNINGNEAVKIMTGAPFPTGADSVIRLEDAFYKDGKIFASEGFKKGDAHRFAGEETRVGDRLLDAGVRLGAAHIMQLAAQGITHVSVLSRPKIGIFSSGNELKEPWQNADDMEIYNANAWGVIALLREVGADAHYLGIIEDDLNATLKSFENAHNYDILLCSGGASKGEADYMQSALKSLGYEEIFSKVNIRPGGPCKAFCKNDKLVIALPGNPMAAFLMAFLLVIPVATGCVHDEILATTTQGVKLKSGRQNIVLGTLIQDKDGYKFHITNDNKFGSGMIKPLVLSNAIYISSEDQSELKANLSVKIIKFSKFS